MNLYTITPNVGPVNLGKDLEFRSNVISKRQSILINNTSIGSLNDLIATNSTFLEHDEIASDINKIIGATDDYLVTELPAITKYYVISDVLELEYFYSNGGYSYYSVDVVTSKDPQAVTNYVLPNDLGK